MATKQSILNRAAALIGAERILDPNNPATARERRLIDLYDMVYEEVLSMWPWGCARERVMLAVMEEKPAWGFQHKYALPGGIVQVAAARTFGAWEVEGRHLLTDFAGPSLPVLVIARVAEEHLHPLVAALVSKELAAAAVGGVSDSATLQERAERRLDPAFVAAAAVDGTHGSSLAKLGSGWVLSMQYAYAPELEVLAAPPSGHAGWGE